MRKVEQSLSYWECRDPNIERLGDWSLCYSGYLQYSFSYYYHLKQNWNWIQSSRYENLQRLFPEKSFQNRSWFLTKMMIGLDLGNCFMWSFWVNWHSSLYISFRPNNSLLLHSHQKNKVIALCVTSRCWSYHLVTGKDIRSWTFFTYIVKPSVSVFKDLNRWCSRTYCVKEVLKDEVWVEGHTQDFHPGDWNSHLTWTQAPPVIS